MGRSRIRASELVKLLNASPQPIYAVDADYRLVFCNQACLDWTGCQAEDIVGLRCTYQSGTECSGPEAVAVALCPPPEAMAGHQTSGTVCRPGPEGKLQACRARFVQVAGDEDLPLGVVVVVDSHGSAKGGHDEPAHRGSEATWLHDRLRRFRQDVSAGLRVDRLVGDSPAMRRARAQVAVAAQSDASVLIVGPPGSGRQRVAGTIHYEGAKQPPGNLIPLACSVLGPELIGSTVHAAAGQRGENGQLAGGTLLLNDVDQLPGEAQEHVASAVTSADFPLRLIATARQPLEAVARQGRYHRQLAALLSTITIEIPPLAERREDIPLLAQAILEELNARGGKQLSGFTSEALDWLSGHDWPGNVDELAATVAEAHGRAQGPLVEVTDLPQRIHLARKMAAHPRRVEERIVLDEFLARIERELIQRALREAKGNKAKAARLLGMTRPRLYRRLVQLGLAKGP